MHKHHKLRGSFDCGLLRSTFADMSPYANLYITYYCSVIRTMTSNINAVRSTEYYSYIYCWLGIPNILLIVGWGSFSCQNIPCLIVRTLLECWAGIIIVFRSFVAAICLTSAWRTFPFCALDVDTIYISILTSGKVEFYLCIPIRTQYPN